MEWLDFDINVNEGHIHTSALKALSEIRSSNFFLAHIVFVSTQMRGVHLFSIRRDALIIEGWVQHLCPFQGRDGNSQTTIVEVVQRPGPRSVHVLLSYTMAQDADASLGNFGAWELTFIIVLLLESSKVVGLPDVGSQLRQ